jgi:hypothetical protein
MLVNCTYLGSHSILLKLVVLKKRFKISCQLQLHCREVGGLGPRECVTPLYSNVQKYFSSHKT